MAFRTSRLAIRVATFGLSASKRAMAEEETLSQSAGNVPFIRRSNSAARRIGFRIGGKQSPPLAFKRSAALAGVPRILDVLRYDKRSSFQPSAARTAAFSSAPIGEPWLDAVPPFLGEP